MRLTRPIRSTVHEVLADDVVENLLADFSQHDRVYSRLANKKRAGGMAKTMARDAAFYQIENTEHRLDAPQLFPEIEFDELQTVMSGFAATVGRFYVDHLVQGSRHQGRQHTKDNFTYPNGEKHCATQYLDFVWAPAYAEEFVTAHALGLTKETAEALQQ